MLRAFMGGVIGLRDRLRGRKIKSVSIEASLDPDEHVAAVQEVFARWGFDVKPGPSPLKGGLPTGLVWGVFLVLTTPIGTFFKTLGTRAGENAFDALKSWVRDLIAAGKNTGGPGVIHIVDSRGGVLMIRAPGQRRGAGRARGHRLDRCERRRPRLGR
jgi:hypothetical protein